MKVAYYPARAGEQSLADLGLASPPGGTVVTIGAFDGVHLGHRRLIERVRTTAHEIGALSAVVTFDLHPASVVRPGSAPLLLTDLDQKLALLAAAGADLTLVLHFDAQRAAEPAEDFVAEVLVGCLNARAVVVGHDFHFGRDREGDVALLQRMGARLGFDVTGIRLFALAAGAEAGGRPEAVCPSTGSAASSPPATSGPPPSCWAAGTSCGGWWATATSGGASSGFPTANLEVDKEMQLCADGVYAGWYLRPDGTRHQTAVSVGRQPTFFDVPALLARRGPPARLPGRPVRRNGDRRAGGHSCGARSSSSRWTPWSTR